MGNAIFRELKKKEVDVQVSKVDNGQSPFIVEGINHTLEKASKMKIPKMLFSEFIYETDLTLFFAPAGVGKTILAYQIAESIAKGREILGFKNESEKQPIIYFDFELSPKQVERRYSQKEGDDWINIYEFDKNFHRAYFNLDSNVKLSRENFFSWIITECKKVNAKIVFIDNISWIITQGLETTKEAGPLMKDLNQLKRKYNLTLIVLAHTPKIRKYTPLQMLHLAGSSQLGNFADATMCINWSRLDKSYRYIKQIKARNCDKIYDEENVVTLETKYIEPNFLGFELMIPDEENRDESNHINFQENPLTKVYTNESREENHQMIKELLNENPEISVRDLAIETGLGKSTCATIKKQLQDGS